MKRLAICVTIFALGLTACGRSIQITFQTAPVQTLDCRVVHNPEPPTGFEDYFTCVFDGYEVGVLRAPNKCAFDQIILTSGSSYRESIAVYDLYILTPHWTFGSEASSQEYLRQLREYIRDNYSPPITFVMGTEVITTTPSCES